MFQLSPLRGRRWKTKPWEGNCTIKPWEYQVTAVIPVLDTPVPLKLVVELLRHQSIKPFITVIDTGSDPHNLAEIESMRAEDLEVHSIRLNGVQHSSDYPAIAMDLAFSLCRTPYLFATHADCFLRKQDYLEMLIANCKEIAPVCGHEISPRSHKDWKGMVSHTATMYEMATMDRIGFGWSLRRLCNMYGIADHSPNPLRPNWPDTELLGNYILRKYGIEPHLMGHEENHERNIDEFIDHCRTFTVGVLYSPGWYRTCRPWMEAAMKEATQRIEAWKQLPQTV